MTLSGLLRVAGTLYRIIERKLAHNVLLNPIQRNLQGMYVVVLTCTLATALIVPCHAKDSKGTSTKKEVEHVEGYKKKDGTVVAPHDRTAPNGTQKDNWSAKGNVNPETGKKGSKTPKK